MLLVIDYPRVAVVFICFVLALGQQASPARDNPFVVTSTLNAVVLRLPRAHTRSYCHVLVLAFSMQI